MLHEQAANVTITKDAPFRCRAHQKKSRRSKQLQSVMAFMIPARRVSKSTKLPKCSHSSQDGRSHLTKPSCFTLHMLTGGRCALACPLCARGLWPVTGKPKWQVVKDHAEAQRRIQALEEEVARLKQDARLEQEEEKTETGAPQQSSYSPPDGRNSGGKCGCVVM